MIRVPGKPRGEEVFEGSLRDLCTVTEQLPRALRSGQTPSSNPVREARGPEPQPVLPVESRTGVGLLALSRPVALLSRASSCLLPLQTTNHDAGSPRRWQEIKPRSFPTVVVAK